MKVKSLKNLLITLLILPILNLNSMIGKEELAFFEAMLTAMSSADFKLLNKIGQEDQNIDKQFKLKPNININSILTSIQNLENLTKKDVVKNKNLSTEEKIFNIGILNGLVSRIQGKEISEKYNGKEIKINEKDDKAIFFYGNDLLNNNDWAKKLEINYLKEDEQIYTETRKKVIELGNYLNESFKKNSEKLKKEDASKKQ